MVLISDGEYQYEYNDFLNAVGALDTSKNSGYSFDNASAPLTQSSVKQSPSPLNQDQSDAAAYANVTTRKDQAPYKIVKQTGWHVYYLMLTLIIGTNKRGNDE